MNRTEFSTKMSIELTKIIDSNKLSEKHLDDIFGECIDVLGSSEFNTKSIEFIKKVVDIQKELGII